MKYILSRITTFTTLLIITGFLLSGCATTAKYQKLVDSWKGKKAGQLVDVWGYPDNTIQGSDGSETYVYKNHKVYYSPGICSTGGGACIPVEHTENCDTEFKIKKNIIKQVTFKGDDCVYD